MRRDLKQDIDIVPSINPHVVTATTSGSAVDLNTTSPAPYNAANAYVSVGAYNTGTAKYRLQEKDDGGTWANVTSGNLDGSTTITVSGTGQQNQAFEVAYRGSKDQLRWKITSTNNVGTSGHPGAAYIVAGAKRNK
jgi:hypothetical protein